jgi:hypothetical protein
VASALLAVVLQQPEAASEFVADFVRQMDAAGWGMGFVQNDTTGEFAFGWTRKGSDGRPDMMAPTIPMGILTEDHLRELRETLAKRLGD